MIRYLFMAVALIGAFWGMIEPDPVFAAFMGGSFGFQLAFYLMDRRLDKEARRTVPQKGR